MFMLYYHISVLSQDCHHHEAHIRLIWLCMLASARKHQASVHLWPFVLGSLDDNLVFKVVWNFQTLGHSCLPLPVPFIGWLLNLAVCPMTNLKPWTL